MMDDNKKLRKRRGQIIEAQRYESRGNEILYQLCSGGLDLQNGDGRDPVGAEFTKVWFIGRTYGVALERGVKPRESKPTPSEVYLAVAKELKALKWDQASSNTPLVHRQDGDWCVPCRGAALVQVLKKGMEAQGADAKEQHSFASKYMHFHAPEHVPIYDSISCRGMGKLHEYVCGDPHPSPFGGGQNRQTEVLRDWELFLQRFACLLSRLDLPGASGNKVVRRLDNACQRIGMLVDEQYRGVAELEWSELKRAASA